MKVGQNKEKGELGFNRKRNEGKISVRNSGKTAENGKCVINKQHNTNIIAIDNSVWNPLSTGWSEKCNKKVSVDNQSILKYEIFSSKGFLIEIDGS